MTASLARQFILIFAGFLCVAPASSCGQDLSRDLEKDPNGPALLTFARRQIRIQPFRGPAASLCISDSSFIPYVGQDGKTIVWRTNDSFRIQSIGSATFIHQQNAGPALYWAISVPHHPEAMAYAQPISNRPLTDKVTFDATPDTAKDLGWPSPHFEREQQHAWVTPSWSPDGKQLAFGFLGTDPKTGTTGSFVRLWNILSGEVKDLPSATSPSWSPDGQSISYLRSYGPQKQLAGEARLYRVASGRDDKLFAFDNLDVTLPLRWSPDGQYLLYGRIVIGGRFTLAPNTEDDVWIYRVRDGATTQAFRVPRETIVTRGPDWINSWQELERTPGPLLKKCN